MNNLYKKTLFFLVFILFHTMVFPFYISAAVQDELPTEWNYKKIFLPSEIPVPDSAKDYDGNIKAIYSPSVIKIDAKYYMFFGVSVFCAGNTVARDSIALAESSNGFDWVFKRYIIEPDPGMCWRKPGDYIFQLNDPSVYFDPNDPNTILVFYTTVRSARDNFGNIGLAKFDRQLNQTFRNDLFLNGTTEISAGGFSRPAVNWFEPNGPRLYFDSSAHLASVPLSNFNELNSVVLRNENIVATDVHLPPISNNETLLLSSNGVAVTRAMNQSSWNPSWFITKLSGQEWDKTAQGSPEMFFDDDCKPRIYMAGIQMNSSGTDYDAINIGVASPLDDKNYSFDFCRRCRTPSPPIMQQPVNNATIKNGVSYQFSWNNSVTDNISTQQICISTNQTNCDILWKNVSSSINSVVATIPDPDDLITWSVNNVNACGKQAVASGVFKSGIIPTKIGDINLDGYINIFDFNHVVSGLGLKYTIQDYQKVIENFGN